MMEQFLTAIGNFGFPIVVASYLLLRMETKLEKLSCGIRDLQEAIKDLADKIK